MLEENKMNNPFGDDAMDLGSSDFGGMFDDTDLDKLFGTDEKPAEEPKVQEVETVSKDVSADEIIIAQQTIETNEPQEEEDNKNEGTISEPVKEEVAANITPTNENKLESDEDIYAAELATAQKKETENAKSVLSNKLPIFVYGKAKDEIVDTSITFEALRMEKAEDFPELDDGDNVSWKVTYGTISKTVVSPKDTTIASFKKKIEESKDFSDAIKKSKGDMKCEITPSVKAKKKGVMSAYKGLYESVEEAQKSNKTISYVPSENGRLYEIRSTGVGTFIAETHKATTFSKVRAGFIPALPKIPFSVLSEVLAFFKSYITNEHITEALAYVFWSISEERYFVHIPKQEVSKASVDTTDMPLDDERFILVMEIHSHNTMPAYFSRDDDKDERATGLYAVAGNFDKVFPDILVRISVGGKFVDIPMEDVFEGFAGDFPLKWKDAVTIKRVKDAEVKQDEN